MKRVPIVLVNWNGWGDTIECLESLFRLERVRPQVIVCDNASSDNSLERIKAWANGSLDVWLPASPLRKLSFPPVPKPIPWVEITQEAAETGVCAEDAPLMLVRVPRNLGFAGGNNVGLRYLLGRGGFEQVWLLNNDTVVAPDALIAMLDREEMESRLGICGSTLLRYHRPERIQARGGGYYCKWIGLPWHLGQLNRLSDRYSENHNRYWMNYVVGASMLVSRQFIEDVGLLCEDYFLFFEETDWAARAGSTYAFSWAPESRVYHKVGASIGTSSNPRKKSMLCDYYAIRNRIIFTRKYFPEALPTVFLTVIIAFFSRFISGRFDLASQVWRIIIGRSCSPISVAGNACRTARVDK